MLVAACSGGDGPTSIKSDDGSASLAIPAGAFPEGFDKESVAAVRINDDDRWVPSDRRILAAYSLEPDGAVLADAITLTIRLPLSLVSSSFEVLHLRTASVDEQLEDAIETVELETFTIDADSAELVIVAQLQHFSTVVVAEGAFDIELTAPDRVPVGHKFTARALVRRTSRAFSHFIKYEGLLETETKEIVTVSAAEGPWTIFGGYSRNINVRPSVLRNVPPRTSVSTQTFTSSSQFTCVESGKYSLFYQVQIRHPQRAIIDLFVKTPRQPGARWG